MVIRKRTAIINTTWLILLIFAFILIGMLVLDMYRYAIAMRRAFNYAQAVAQAAAGTLTLSDAIPNPQNGSLLNRPYLTESRVNNFCAQMQNWVWEIVSRSTWEVPYYYIRTPSPVTVRCKITEVDRTVLEIMVILRFDPIYSPFFPDLDAFGYSRVRLQSGIEGPF